MTLPTWKISLAAAALLALAGMLAAQTHSGTVQGRLTDEHGSPISGGTVTLHGPMAPQGTRTDAQGQFRFLQVAPATYSVTAAATGFATVTRDAILVSVGRLTTVEIPLRVLDVSEEITVSGETPLIDPGRVATGQNFAREQLTEVPTSRDIWSLVQQVPGLQLDTVNVAGNASATLGGPSLSNRGSGNVAYAIEGATITDSFYGFATDRQNGGTSIFFDYGTFEDVEVVTGGSSLDQQNSGVTINVVTEARNELVQGLGPVSLCLRKLAVGQHAGIFVRRGAPDQQHALHSGVRRRARWTAGRGPAVALGRRRAPGHIPEPDDLPRERGSGAGNHHARAVEREAQRPDLEPELAEPLLPEKRPKPVRHRGGV